MLKTNIPPEKSIPKRLRVDDGEIDRFGVGDSKEIARKSRKSKSKKLSKS